MGAHEERYDSSPRCGSSRDPCDRSPGGRGWHAERSGSMSSREGLGIAGRMVVHKTTARPIALISLDFSCSGLRVGTWIGRGYSWRFVIVRPISRSRVLSGHGRSLGRVCYALVFGYCPVVSRCRGRANWRHSTVTIRYSGKPALRSPSRRRSESPGDASWIMCRNLAIVKSGRSRTVAAAAVLASSSSPSCAAAAACQTRA
jgi:hypothetical protein